MAAQWKVLHLLFRQSDYLKITMHHIIQSLTGLFLIFFISLLSHRGFVVHYLRGAGPESNSREWLYDGVLHWIFFPLPLW